MKPSVLRLGVIYCSFAAALISAPSIPAGVLFRPTFLWSDRSLTAGSAFLAQVAIEHHSYTLLLTCYHVLGDQPAGVVGVAGVCIENPNLVISGPHYLPIKSKRRFSAGDADGELSAFVIDQLPSTAHCLKLAPRPPGEGEVVFIFAKAFGASEPKLHRATIAGVTRTQLDYVFDDADLELGGTSGSPVINEKAQVVGINVAGGKAFGTLHGYANPVGTVAAQIAESLANRSRR